jgi:hypothetical protein
MEIERIKAIMQQLLTDVSYRREWADPRTAVSLIEAENLPGFDLSYFCILCQADDELITSILQHLLQKVKTAADYEPVVRYYVGLYVEGGMGPGLPGKPPPIGPED